MWVTIVSPQSTHISVSNPHREMKDVGITVRVVNYIPVSRSYVLLRRLRRYNYVGLCLFSVYSHTTPVFNAMPSPYNIPTYMYMIIIHWQTLVSDHPNRSHSSYDLRMMNVGNPYLQYSRGIENPMLLQKLSHNKYDHNIYHTINFKPKEYAKPNVLQRKCISMENLKGASGGGGSGSGAAPGNSNSLRKSKESTGKMQCINISNPQLVNNSTLKSYYNMPFGYIYDVPYKNNSKMSLGTNGSDDVRGYRDVAL